ncbi:iron-containing alcohol dehydrogenase [Oceanicella actignis]|uniref:iron-containing alcohol dehydrogenase n=1 Tax=Oceanicella actignis TaxID=1189325 RepID=UPI0011E6FF14|nr:iron-containing alcohol dehydrogenase [Oceanicella actignis]TYO90435.1 alcohol dehydrogenase class IV [Oceanicella actignis]
MTPFTFRTTPAILSEPGATARIGALAADLGVTRAAFVTDRMILDLGLAQPALDGLAAAGIEATVFSDVVADPPEEVVLGAVARAREAGCDGVVSVGGGSSMDTAKLVALLLVSDQPLEQIYGVDQARGRRAPLILAPTTAGTGSEVTPISIVTTGQAEKKGVVAPQLLPDWAVLDADLTLGLPREVTAATGVDAMVHAIEAYTSRHRKNPVSDALAREALRLLGANIRRVCDNPRDREARAAMLLGSMLAGQAFANAPVAAVHALAYPLGGHFHVPHGLSNCLVLPHVLEYNMPAAEALYAELAPIVFEGARGAADLVEGFRRLAPEIGLKTRLSEVGVGHNHLPMLAEDAMKQTRLLVNNPREMTLEAARAIYEAAL